MTEINVMSKEIWCTLGPSSLNDRVIGRLEELGVSLFRLNLSHTKIDQLPKTLEYIQSRTKVPVCLDTEGAQVRTTDLNAGKIEVRENSTIRIHYNQVSGDSSNLNLTPENIAKQLKIGDLLKMDADVLVQVVVVESEWVVARVLNGGEIGQNKAVTVLERDIAMPAMTEKDQQAMTIGKKFGIRHVALSFANRAADVDEIRALAHPEAMVTSKIECLNGLRNLPEIAEKSDALLIDRGDLSRQVNIEKIPALQKDIIHHAKVTGVKIYVATNLLESMITSANPTRAEVNDVFNTLMDGADGLVLAAETAIGAYPVFAASMIRKVIREYENKQRWQQIDHSSEPLSTLIEPHGGVLINREATNNDSHAFKGLQVLRVKDTDLMDCVQIANGTYSPLTGFMSSEELGSVLNNHRLPDGQAWPMPVVLQVHEDSLINISEKDRIALADLNGKIHATMEVSEIYAFDLEELMQKWFGTTSPRHPGVAKLADSGNRFIAGEITLIEPMASLFQQFELNPTQTRMIFTQKGWSRVVGIHTSTAPNRFHEFIQVQALENAHADGIYISPVIGPQKSGDFLPDPIFKSYQLLLKAGVYPSGKMLLGASWNYPRYCGSREAVFNAICYKNMGCSHFVVERDHSCFEDLYDHTKTLELFESLNDIEVTPLFFDSVDYKPETGKYAESKTAKTIAMRDKEIQAAIAKKQNVPDWVMRGIVQEMLHEEISGNRPVFNE